MDNIDKFKDVSNDELLSLYKDITEFVQYLNKEIDEIEKMGDNNVRRDKQEDR